MLTVNPPPQGFQAVVAPTEVPVGIPSVDLSQRPFDPADFAGRGVEGGVGYGVAGGTGTVDPDEVPVGDADVVSPANLPDVRFEPVVLISQPVPKYPPGLQQAGISGVVKLRFVVDTTGRVEPTSIKGIESTHRGFERPARESVAAAVFHPARIGDRPVRALANQPIRFVTPGLVLVRSSSQAGKLQPGGATQDAIGAWLRSRRFVFSAGVSSPAGSRAIAGTLRGPNVLPSTGRQ